MRVFKPLIAFCLTVSIVFLTHLSALGADVVDTAVSAGSFETLTTALKEAGLVETLKGDGPFTVFAPTDDAFAQLPDGTVEDLLKPENKEKLSNILLYHVVAGKVTSDDIKPGSVKTVQGESVQLSVGKGVLINDASVIKADVMADNGVIHVIDKVLIP
ncbi:MAG: fasciclin domain-containing protein [Microcoleaceae cyanobacterium]